jgi:ribose transport system substrate-binding protein
MCSVLLPFSLSLLLAGCGGSPEGPSEADRDRENEPRWTIGFSQCNLDEPWRVQMNKDILAAVEAQPDVRLIAKDAQNDSTTQQNHLHEFIRQRVDLIIVSPTEAVPLTGPVGQAIDRGIPVIVLDRAIVGQKYTCFIGADNRKIGRAAGAWLAEKLDGKGNIVELKGLTDSVPAIERHEGFREAIVNANFDILMTADMKWLEEDGREEMESALARFDNIDAVYAHNDPGAHGAYLAAKEAGREDGMLFVSIGALPNVGIAYVKQGILDATFEYPTGGKQAVETALKILAGEEVPKNITLGSRLYTPENVDQGGVPIP